MAEMGSKGRGGKGEADQASGVAESSGLITVGEIVGVYGVKGWVKVKSATQPQGNILHYAPWWLKTRHGVQRVEVDQSRQRPQGLVVHLVDLDDRDEAAALRGVKIAVERDQLPGLEEGDYYWHQLIGLTVISQWQGNEYHLGEVKSLLETGANDVLVVKDSAEKGSTEKGPMEKGPMEKDSIESVDQRERLIPYLPGNVIRQIDLEQGVVTVEWDPDF